MKLLRIVALLVIWPLAVFATVTSQVDKTGPFLITAVPQTIPTGFPFVAGSELLVLDLGPASAPYDPAQVLTLGSDYTVTGGNYNTANQMQTGSVLLVGTGAHSVAANDFVVLMRNVPVNQTASFTSTGPLTLALLEQALDKQATLSQQVNEIAARSLQFENWETLRGTMLNSSRASKYLAFDATGAPVYLAGTTSPADASSILATATGASQSRTLASYFADAYNVQDFTGADPTGVADSSAAITAAITALGTKGGTVNLGRGIYRISSSITVNAGVTLLGDSVLRDPRDTSVFKVLGGAILMDAGTTIHLKQAASLNGLTIAKTGMTFPQNAAAVATWADTAVTIDAGAHGATVQNCNIVGFARIADMGTASFTEKVHFRSDAFDGQAGVRIVSGTDSPFLEYLNLWPLASVAGSPVDADLQRSGNAIELNASTAAIDSPSLAHIHTYGYATGVRLVGVNGATLTDVVNDYTTTKSVTVRGIYVTGDSINTQVANGRSYRQTYGIDFEPTTAYESLQVANYDAEYSSGAGIYLTNGYGSIIGSQFKGQNAGLMPYGIQGNNLAGTCLFTIANNTFDYTTDSIAMTGSSPGDTFLIGNLVATGNGTNVIVGAGVNTYSSATTLVIPPSHKFFKVSGTTTITSIASTFATIDQPITLYFTNTLTLTNGSTLKLAGSTNATTSNGFRITLAWDGSAWNEISRVSP